MTQHALYQWPHPLALYPDRGKKSYRMKRLRYRLRSLLHRQAIKKFEEKTPNAIQLRCSSQL